MNESYGADQLTAAIQEQTKQALEAAGKRIVDRSKGTQEFQGTYLKSLTKSHVSPSVDGFELHITNSSVIAGFIEHGTKPHVIVPRDPSGWLVFELNGETVFRKSVNHPGNKAYKWLESSVNAEMPQLLIDLQT